MESGPQKVFGLRIRVFFEDVRFARSSKLGILLVPFRPRTSVTAGSETVVTYVQLPHLLPLITRGLGIFGLAPGLEKVVGRFIDERLFLLELLPTFIICKNRSLYPASPTGQGFAHLPEGGFVYFIPFEIFVIERIRELVSCV